MAAYKAVVEVLLVFFDGFVGKAEISPRGLDVLLGRDRWVELDYDLLVVWIAERFSGSWVLSVCLLFN